MKIILIKNSPAGKTNEVVDVADGYAKNFLIRNGLALPYNESTKQALTKTLSAQQAQTELLHDQAISLKKQIENIKLHFSLKVTDMVVHGSVTRKQVLQQLQQKGIKVDVHAIDAVHITSLGVTRIVVRLQRDVLAELKVEVASE